MRAVLPFDARGILWWRSTIHYVWDDDHVNLSLARSVEREWRRWTQMCVDKVQNRCETRMCFRTFQVLYVRTTANAHFTRSSIHLVTRALISTWPLLSGCFDWGHAYGDGHITGLLSVCVLLSVSHLRNFLVARHAQKRRAPGSKFRVHQTAVPNG